MAEQAAHELSDTYNGGRGRDFCRGWKFFLGEAPHAQQPEYDDSAWRALDLPHDWSIELPFREDSPASTGGGFLDGGTGWYRKTFTVPEADAERRIFLGFDGAYMNSQVWLNGTLLGARPYGYVSFEYELTGLLKRNAPNTIAVRLENKQPSSRWYSGSGLYRRVWWTALNPVHMDYCGVFVSASEIPGDPAGLRISASIRNQSEDAVGVTLEAVVRDSSGTIAGTARTESMRIDSQSVGPAAFPAWVSNPRRWSLQDPHLYTLECRVLCDGKTVDTYRCAFGLRTFEMDAGTGCTLNGTPVKLNGVCLHHDLGALGAAVHRRAIERQLEIMRAMGCNAVRTTHNPPDPALLDLCDRLGLLVIDEVFDAWEDPNKCAYDYHMDFRDWAERDLRATVRRDRNHPCVIMYSIGNEIPDVKTPKGVEWTRRLRDWTREEDATRLVTHGSNFNEWGTAAAAELDAVGYNYNTHLYDLHHAQFPGWKLYASETCSALRSRGVYKTPTGENLLAGEDGQCSSYDNSLPEWGLSAEASYKLVNSRPYIAGEFIWSGFDYLGEPTPYGWPSKNSYFGIVDTCGFPKDIYYFYQSRWTTEPMVHLLPHWNWPAGRVIPVWAYTNGESAELFLNGRSLGIRRFSEGGPLHLEWLVPFEPGVLRVEAHRDGRRAASMEIRTAGPAARVRLTADRTLIHADGEDLAFLTAEIVDREGTLMPDAGHRVDFSLHGPGVLARVDNGNSISHEAYQTASRKAFNGKCLAIVRSSGTPGIIRVSANCRSLEAGSTEIITEPSH